MQNTIRLAVVNDVDELASIHAASWDPSEISVKLGSSYLKAFYGEVVSNESSFCYVFEHDQKIIGYACGFSNYQKFNEEFLKSYRILIANRLLLGIILFKVSIKEVVDLFDYKYILSRLHSAQYHLGALALRVDFKGKAIGGDAIKQVIGKVLESFRESKARTYWGVCDKKNIPMARYLEKLGFSRVADVKFRSKSLLLYEHVIELLGVNDD